MNEAKALPEYTFSVPMQELSEQLARLEHVTDHLNSRLSPLLAPPLPQAECLKKNGNPRTDSEISERLREFINRASGCADRLSELAERL